MAGISENWVFNTKHRQKEAQKVADKYYARHKGMKQVRVAGVDKAIVLKWVKK